MLDAIEYYENAKVVGLTATPFTAGMADHWDGIVNGATVNQLLAGGWLSPLKIKACVTPDMKGVKRKFTGEYEDEEAGQRGITIIGDVVKTWLEQCAKHFGRCVKTIVFSPSVTRRRAVPPVRRRRLLLPADQLSRPVPRVPSRQGRGGPQAR